VCMHECDVPFAPNVAARCVGSLNCQVDFEGKKSLIFVGLFCKLDQAIQSDYKSLPLRTA